MSQKRLMTQVKFDTGQNIAQILENDISKPQNWETFSYLRKLKFSEDICN